VVWTPAAQAELINSALHRLGVSHAIVLGHSWGASIAVALALKYPNLVQGLVLASGYYYPTLRPDVVALSAPAVPLVGDVLGHTLSPIVSRVMWPLLMTKIFGPRSVPKKFAELQAQGRGVSRGRIERLMRHHGIRAIMARPRRVRTTDSRHDLPIANDSQSP
jgi:pimeloyl-ACP methyl ester carboxylesterase